MEPEEFLRKEFSVFAEQVTVANMAEIAEWCNGTVMENGNEQVHIKVKVYRPLNERQSKAFVGDWVLLDQTNQSYKVYTDRAFTNTFYRKSVSQEHNVFDPVTISVLPPKPGPSAFPNNLQKDMNIFDKQNTSE